MYDSNNEEGISELMIDDVLDLLESCCAYRRASVTAVLLPTNISIVYMDDGIVIPPSAF